MLIAAAAAILIAAAVAASFGAEEAWLLVALLAGAYGLSRGVSRNDWPAQHAARPLNVRATPPAEERTGETVEGGAAEVVVSEEELQVDKRRRPRERVLLRKDVVTEHVTITVPVRREVLRVERIPIEPGEEPEAREVVAFTGGEVQELVLMEEQAVVDKRIVPRERVRLSKDVMTDEQHITETVRREEVDVDHEPRRDNERETPT